jgi:hypothetical protein
MRRILALIRSGKIDGIYPPVLSVSGVGNLSEDLILLTLPFVNPDADKRCTRDRLEAFFPRRIACGSACPVYALTSRETAD